MSILAAAAVDTLVVIALTLLVVGLLRRRPAALRHAVLAAGLTAAAAAPLLEAAGPRWELPVLASAEVTSSGLTLTSNAPSGAAWIESRSTTATPAISSRSGWPAFRLTSLREWCYFYSTCEASNRWPDLSTAPSPAANGKSWTSCSAADAPRPPR